jgi:hypothetical protein
VGLHLGYIGRWAMRELVSAGDGRLEGIVEHRITSASLPELLSEDPARPFTVAGDQLCLGNGRTYRRTFRRL